jgi:hypothetical protein
MTDYPLTGGCLCGGVRYEISEPLIAASYCHCTRCQRRTGAAASPQAQIAPGSMTFLSGADLPKAFAPPDGFEKLFCTNCGSAIGSRRAGAEELFAVRLGTFDSDPGIRPRSHMFVAYAAPWEPLPDDGLPRFDERPT